MIAIKYIKNLYSRKQIKHKKRDKKRRNIQKMA
jgi:hypothetical protein